MKSKKKPKLVEIEYSANNSGGRWWLKTKDWLALEKAGWWIEWGGLWFCASRFSSGREGDPEVKPKTPCKGSCHGHRYAESEKTAREFLGSKAQCAKKSFASPKDAILEFERLTGQSASDQGCNCCGAPHSFKWGSGKDWRYVSGEDVCSILYGDDSPRSLREALERSR